MPQTDEQAHTPAPWKTGAIGAIHTADEHEHYTAIAHSGSMDGGWKVRNARTEANARRIVAAVNACEGIPSEWLESDGLQQLMKAVRWYRHVVVGDGQSLREAQQAIEKALP